MPRSRGTRDPWVDSANRLLELLRRTYPERLAFQAELALDESGKYKVSFETSEGAPGTNWLHPMARNVKRAATTVGTSYSRHELNTSLNAGGWSFRTEPGQFSVGLST